MAFRTGIARTLEARAPPDMSRMSWGPYKRERARQTYGDIQIQSLTTSLAIDRMALHNKDRPTVLVIKGIPPLANHRWVTSPIAS